MLSLIMPVYNEGATLGSVLKVLGDVDFPVAWELIIVDDGSTDGAVERIDRTWLPTAESVTVVSATQNQGYKFFTRERYEQMCLTASGFEIEAELTGGLVRSGARVYEVPIDYAARSRDEGKKIRAVDGVRGLVRLFRVRVVGR